MNLEMALRAANMPDEEAQQLAALVAKIEAKQHPNRRRARYYEGKKIVQELGIAVPPQMRAFRTVVGWPSTVVDAIEERLDIDDFAVRGASADDFGIGEIWHDNQMPVYSGMANHDGLIYGCGFVTVTPGGAGEPDPLMTVEPATSMTGEWDVRRRRLTSAACATWDAQGQVDSAALFALSGIWECRRDGTKWEVVRQDNWLAAEHRIPVYRLVNRQRTSKPWGQSEITRAVMSYTDTAVRTLLGMEVAREFYSSPQRYILGANESSFVDANGNPKTAWETYLGRFLALEADDDGVLPQVGQFSASSPEPYVAQVKLMAEMLAAEAALPLTYLGFHTHNPPGGDGIRAQETRTVKRAERRQRMLGYEYAQALSDAVFLRDKERPPRITTLWRDPSTPTRAATADAGAKYIAAGVLRPDSEVTREWLGFDEPTRARLAEEDRRNRSRDTLTALSAAASAVRSPLPTTEAADANAGARD